MTITILDGGMGQELVSRAPDAPTPLWSTRVMLDHPDLVRAVHDDYFAAGAEVATVNSYAIHHDRLEPAGLDHQFGDLHAQALSLARAARDAHGAGRVAGALGPLGWSYDAKAAPPAAEAARLYAEIVAIQDASVDLFIAETMSGIDQARGAFLGMAAATKPRWVAFSVEDADGTRLRSGEALSDALPLIHEFAPDAVLINCARPEAISAALPILAQSGRPFGAYANGFDRIAESFAQRGKTVDELRIRNDLTPAAYADIAESWIGMGATILGGCCEIGPGHIAELARRFGTGTADAR